MFYIYPVRQILFLVSSWSWWWRDTSPHRLVCPVVSSKYYFIIEQEIRRNWPYIFSFSRVIQSECTRTSWRICHCTQPELALEISCCIFYYNIVLWVYASKKFKLIFFRKDTSNVRNMLLNIRTTDLTYDEVCWLNKITSPEYTIPVAKECRVSDPDPFFLYRSGSIF